MSRRAERPLGLAVATPTALRPRSGASLRSEVAPGAGKGKKGRRAEAVTAKRVSADSPKLKIMVTRPSEASAGVQRSRSRPQRPRTGSPNAVRSAGTGKRGSTSCRRDGPVAAQRSSGASRRQEGVILTSPVPGASKRSEVAPGTGRLQRTKPEGRGGLAAQRESADGPEAEGSPFGADGSRRGSLAAAARSAAPQADAAAGSGGGEAGGTPAASHRTWLHSRSCLVRSDAGGMTAERGRVGGR